MSVAELAKHLRAHLKKLFAVHGGHYLLPVSFVHLVPVELVGGSLFGEETIVLVQRAPQGFEVAGGGVVELVFGYAAGKEPCRGGHEAQT